MDLIKKKVFDWLEQKINFDSDHFACTCPKEKTELLKELTTEWFDNKGYIVKFKIKSRQLKKNDNTHDIFEIKYESK